MLYELISIIRTPKFLTETRYQEAKFFSENLGKLILNNRGVIRKIENNGLLQFQEMRKVHNETFFEGYKVTMLYDCSPTVQSQIMKNLGKDPRVLTYLEVKHENKLDSTALDNIRGK